MARRTRASGAGHRSGTKTSNARKRDGSERSNLGRKQRVLSHVAPSFTSSIANAAVIKSEGLFFLMSSEGGVPVSGGHGLGLYYHDCRYLDGYELEVNGGEPRVLACTASEGDAAVLELTNPDTSGKKNRGTLSEVLGIRWERKLDGGRLTLTDRISLRNFSETAAKLSLSLSFCSKFEDIFVVRGMLPVRARHRLRREHTRDSIVYSHRGLDEVTRSTSICFSPRPSATTVTNASWKFTLAPHETMQVEVAISVAEDPVVGEPDHIASRSGKVSVNPQRRGSENSKRHASRTHVTADNPNLDRLLDRSLADLQMLRTNIGGAEFFAAGVPWFVTLFGRDSIVTALQTLAFDSGIAEQTLRVLARYQGREVDTWREEQPGKVLHELRVDELTRANLLPYSPYYGTIDATPLFLILFARHAAWTG